MTLHTDLIILPFPTRSRPSIAVNDALDPLYKQLYSSVKWTIVKGEKDEWGHLVNLPQETHTTIKMMKYGISFHSTAKQLLLPSYYFPINIWNQIYFNFSVQFYKFVITYWTCCNLMIKRYNLQYFLIVIFCNVFLGFCYNTVVLVYYSIFLEYSG